MRLVACGSCRAQFDVSGVDAAEFRCHCGATVSTDVPAAVDAQVRRCGSCGALLADGATTCEYCNASVVRDPKQLSLICPGCYARNPDRSRFCTHCGLRFRPNAVPQEGEVLACPCCEEPMAVRGIGGVRVQECRRCQGLWVPGESFDVLVSRAVEARRSMPASGLGASRPKTAPRPAGDFKTVYRRCPVCGRHMQRRNFGRRSGVIVDWCGQDGTWLDADELGDIAAFILGGGLERATGGWTGPGSSRAVDPDEITALATAERLMAEERRSRATTARHRLPLSLGELLQDLLDV